MDSFKPIHPKKILRSLEKTVWTRTVKIRSINGEKFNPEVETMSSSSWTEYYVTWFYFPGYSIDPGLTRSFKDRYNFVMFMMAMRINSLFKLYYIYTYPFRMSKERYRNTLFRVFTICALCCIFKKLLDSPKDSFILWLHNINYPFQLHYIARFSIKPASYIFKYHYSSFFKGFRCGKSNMRSKNNIRCIQKRMIRGDRRFHFKNINTCSRDQPVFKSFCQGLLINNCTSCHIYQY